MNCGTKVWRSWRQIEKPVNEINDNKWLCDLASIVDITIYLSELNVKLHDTNLYLDSLLSNDKTIVVK